MYWRCAPYFLAIAAFSCAVNVYAPSLTSLGEDLGRSAEGLSWLYSVLSIGFFSMIPFCYRWVPRLNKDMVLFAGIAALAVALFFPSWFTFAPVFVVTAYAMGAGSGIAEIVATAALSDAVAPERRRTLLNFSQVFYCIGAVGVPIFFGILFRYGYDWRDGFRIVGGLCVVAAVAVLWHARHVGSPPPRRRAERSRMRDIADNRTLVVLILGLLLYVSAEMGYANYIATYFEKTLGAPRSLASMVTSLFWLGQFAGRVLYGLVHLPITDRRSIVLFNVLCFAAALPILFTHSAAVAAVCVFFVGLGCSICWPTIMTLISRAETEHTEAAISLAIGVGALGYFVGPPLVGLVTTLSGSFRIGMTGLSVIVLANIALFHLAPMIRGLREDAAPTKPA